MYPQSLITAGFTTGKSQAITKLQATQIEQGALLIRGILTAAPIQAI